MAKRGALDRAHEPGPGIERVAVTRDDSDALLRHRCAEGAIVPPPAHEDDAVIRRALGESP